MPLLLHVRKYLIRECLLLLSFLAVNNTAEAQLKAGFQPDKIGGCSPLTVSFSNTTTGASAAATYSWDLGNTKVSSLPNPGSTYINEQTYTITLTVKDGAQTATASQVITVYKKPTVDFTASPTVGCLPLPVNFSSQSSAGDGVLTDYFWDFADGATQQGAGMATAAHTYTFAQTAAVSLTVTNSYGCYNTLQKQAVIISPTVKASFTADKLILCQTTDAVQFTNTSSGGAPLTYNWDFGDGTGSTDPAPSHVFNAKGAYTIKLLVTGAGGCTDISTEKESIHVADFSTDFRVPGQICQGAATIFQDISTPQATTGVWQFDDGSTGNTAGGSSPPHVFTTPGSRMVTLTNTYGICRQSASKLVPVVEAPYLPGFLSTTLPGCTMPVTVEFTDTTSTAVKWQWDFDPALPVATSSRQAPSYAYTTEGYYNVRLTVTNAAGCNSTVGKTIGIFKPSVFISWLSSTSARGNTSCGDFSMTFSASSNSDPITTWQWDFGDGGASTEAQPLHHFTIPGTYIIRLHYTTNSGCQGTAEYSSVHLYQQPVAGFTVGPGTTICGNAPVQFTDQSQGPVTEWSWNFGDGSSLSSIASPNHRYNSDSLYTITLIVSNEYCSDTLSRKDYLTVLPPFPRIAGVESTCEGTRGLMIFGQQTIKGQSWQWDFGDGVSLPASTDPGSVQHNYTATGVYEVTLTATNGNCHTRDSLPISILLKQHPVLSAASEEVCASDALPVSITGFDPNPVHDQAPPNHSYDIKSWQYTDGSPFTGTYTDGIYYKDRTYAGSLQGLTNRKDSLRVILLSYGFSCRDTSNFIPLTVKGPAAAYTIVTNDVCFHTPIVLQPNAHGNGNVPLSHWTWNYGDGQTETIDQGVNISHVYPAPGAYNPVLTVTDMDGCQASSPPYPTPIQVNGPKAGFTWSPTAVSPNTMVYFNNSTNTTGSGDTQYQWSFGDGGLSTDAYPSHSYNSISADTVRLIAHSATAQCTDTAIQVLYVKTVHTSFRYTISTINNNSCPPMVVRFANNSINAVRVSWDFGDGSTADNQAYPSHTYYQPGVYRVVLYGYANDGTSDSTASLITINGPYAIVSADTLSGCIGQVVTLSALVKNASSFTWDFADGTLDLTQDSFAVHQYLTGGIYTPGLILKDGNGCTATSILNRPIIIDSLHVAIRNKPPHVCDSTLVVLDPAVSSLASDQLQQPLQYKWGFGTGFPADTSDAVAATFTYRHAGQYPLTLKVTTPYGCSREITDTLLVVDPQPFQWHIAQEAFACPGLPLLLHAEGAASYNWINATGLNDTHSADPLAQPPLQAGYTVVGYDANLCFTDTATIPVRLTPSPTVNAGPDLQVLTGSTVSLNATGSDDVVAWSWSPSDGLSCTDCASPVCTPRQSLSYIVTGKTQYGCPASDTFYLKLICDQGRVYIPNSFTPNGDGKNDRWYIKGKGIRVINYLRIFSRWGEIIFQREHFNIDDASSGWDGTFKGNPVETGTYVYLAEMVCDNGEVFPVKGSFMVIR